MYLFQLHTSLSTPVPSSSRSSYHPEGDCGRHLLFLLIQRHSFHLLLEIVPRSSLENCIFPIFHIPVVWGRFYSSHRSQGRSVGLRPGQQEHQLFSAPAIGSGPPSSSHHKSGLEQALQSSPSSVGRSVPGVQCLNDGGEVIRAASSGCGALLRLLLTLEPPGISKLSKLTPFQ